MASFPNTSIRMFRGRTGANDRQLPKYQARRRKPPKNALGEPRFEEEGLPASHSDQELDVAAQVDYDAIDQDEENHEFIIIDPVPEATESIIQPNPLSMEVGDECTKEIKHLMKRISNVSMSITLSAGAISNPTTWKTNVLNAVLNAVQEWRAILSHYSDFSDSTQFKQPSVALFMLIQQTMQCGPLTCSTPGYFKRCGASVASMALAFLKDVVPDDDDVMNSMLFTERQAQAISKWKSAAAKAVSNGNQASKSQVKHQAGKGKK